MSFSRPRVRRGIALGAAAAVAVGLGVTPTLVADAAAKASRKADVPGVTANLFEWNWTSVAKECTDVLGPAGYSGVQVAPPQDSVKRQGLGDGSDTVLHPWWEVYQPVSYALTSRMGSEAEFRAMVRGCRQAGVKVYVDAVINHMTGQGRTSYGGQSYTPYNYPDVPYVPSDFHYNVGACPSSDGGIQDFNNKQQVFRCNLVGLEDLRTGTDKVQAELAAYLNKLIDYGVSGFRVDAGKHIGQDDLDGIYDRLKKTQDGVRPYWALEVFGGGPGILSPEAFTRSGDVLGLDAGRQIFNAFKSYGGSGNTGSLATLEVFGRGSGLTSSEDTLSFVTNHDTDRNPGEYLTHKDGARYTVANYWLLAEGYGSPQVYSSFEWAEAVDSPPATPDGLITDTVCGPLWTCFHRQPGVTAMVKFHQYVGDAPKRNWYTDEANVIAFSRGGRGWAAFNNGPTAKTIRVQTGLRAGTYCDVIKGRGAGSDCQVPVAVNRNGVAQVRVPASDAVAITKADRL